MTIEQAKDDKIGLELEILKLIKNYEKQTHLEVAKIDIYRSEETGLYSIYLNVELL